MTILTVALKYLRGRSVASTLTAVSIALGVSLVIASVLLARGIKEGFTEGTTDYSLVVGAKGSPMQLVLSVVFRMDVATPNILYTTYRDLQEDPRVDVAVPMALGDAYQGIRYVATNSTYFAAFPWRRKTFSLSVGRFFRDDPPNTPTYEALLGAEAASRTGLRIGDRFYEGEEMAEYPLTVVGILRPTRSADDRAIFFSLSSFWGMNEVARKMEVKPLTAVLATAGGLSGIVGGHAVAYFAGSLLGQSGLVTSPSLFNVFDPAVLASVILLGTLAGLLPAVLAYRTEVANNLAPLS